MSKKSLFLCHGCGATTNKWSGKCSVCNEWGSLEEVKDEQTQEYLKLGNSSSKVLETESISGNFEHYQRLKTKIDEFDKMIGGGLVRGSVILIGGEPGIGKSTLLLQLCHQLSQESCHCLYVSGEESATQIKIRAQRLQINSNIKLISSTSLESICATILSLKNIDFVIIDSIQTMNSEKISASMGSISQVRLCTHELVNLAKIHNITIILVGHITKDGSIAGPKFLEHMVDTVLYFEGENNYRLLRSIKNRYGSTNEIALFEMVDYGLREVTNPSLFFIKNIDSNISGSVIFVGMEGTRPFLNEIQALIVPSYMPMPRRAVVGWDTNRLAMILAVLSSRCDMNCSDKEVYLNVVGGLKLQDPSADLAVAAALISIYFKKVFNEKTVFCGEIGLSGEIRVVSHLDLRIKEAEKLGFSNIIIPDQEISNSIEKQSKIKIIKIKYLQSLISYLN
jgi:DNA repair protein RadA/Sms